jgi:hypothetical protein
MSLYVLKALIVRGDSRGYELLQTKVQTELTNESPDFVRLFGSIIIHEVKPAEAKVYYKFWNQRLFSSLYPMLIGLQSKS